MRWAWRRPQARLIVARGSSDHAAVYGRYLLELATRRPVALAAPSLFTRYGAETDASGWLVVGVSQSGKTPEIVDVVERLRATGGHAIAITNNGDSPLAEAAETVIELGAGAENAVPATKTFTAQMAAFAVLANALGDVPWDDTELAAVPDAVAGVLDDPAGMAELADRWAEIDQLVVTARGWMLSAALETALKVRETALVSAQGFSVADFLHGPIAAVDPGAPVLALRAERPGAADVDEAVGGAPAARRRRPADAEGRRSAGGPGPDRRLRARSAARARARAAQGPGPRCAARPEQSDDYALIAASGPTPGWSCGKCSSAW